jgi:hypothetical protein
MNTHQLQCIGRSAKSRMHCDMHYRPAGERRVAERRLGLDEGASGEARESSEEGTALRRAASASQQGEGTVKQQASAARLGTYGPSSPTPGRGRLGKAARR